MPFLTESARKELRLGRKGPLPPALIYREDLHASGKVLSEALSSTAVQMVALAQTAKSEQIRFAACKYVLDSFHGAPAQRARPVREDMGDDGADPVVMLSTIFQKLGLSLQDIEKIQAIVDDGRTDPLPPPQEVLDTDAKSVSSKPLTGMDRYFPPDT